MGSQRTISKYNLDYYRHDMVSGDYDMPVIYPTIYKPQRLVGFKGYPHTEKGIKIPTPHTHLGYVHGEGGTRPKMTQKETRLVDKVTRAWDNYKRGK